ncbi:MAG TPA: hypothetical protein VMT18_01725 [Planctomycetota bacterium]|nr:hypothetical protein [Planctomycetota bacterium]
MSNEPANERSELWVWCAYTLVLAGVTGLVYLGSRPEGHGPVRVYLTGPPALALSSLAIGLWGLAQSLVRRPFLRRGRLAGWFAVGATIALASYPLPFPSRHDGRPSQVRLELPVEGRWRVRWGGEDPERNLPASARPDRRYGYDLLPEPPAGVDGAGPLVTAPCAARVVAVRDEAGAIATGVHDGLGNHVVLEIAPGQYLFLAGLYTRSIRVAPGSAVERGAPLAQVGGSATGNFTAGQHLVLFLQDTAEPLWGQGIPFAFDELVVNGERVERARPRGQSVREPERSPGDVVERVR